VVKDKGEGREAGYSHVVLGVEGRETIEELLDIEDNGDVACPWRQVKVYGWQSIIRKDPIRCFMWNTLSGTTTQGNTVQLDDTVLDQRNRSDFSNRPVLGSVLSATTALYFGGGCGLT
jgi:hypothetical protein